MARFSRILLSLAAEERRGYGIMQEVVRHSEGTMSRIIYRLLLSLHPTRFRREFPGEMLWIFDEVRADGRSVLQLFGGVFRSLARQWLLRPGFWLPTIAIAAPLTDGD
jgi:hypothetical protein